MNTRLNFLFLRTFVGLICVLIVFQTPLAAQNIGLTIQVLEGNGAQNIVSQPNAKPITVRVMDRTGRVLPGANVEFTAPEYGPGGQFETKLNPIVVSTNGQGIAVAPPFQSNSTPGVYEIQILASYMGEVTRLLLTQNNVISKKKSSTKLFIISAVVGGAAAAAFAAKGGGGSSSPSTTPTTSTTQPPGATSTPTITFLDSTVSAPR